MNSTGGTLLKLFENLNILFMRDCKGEIYLKEIDENGDMKTLMQSKDELSEES